MATRKGTYLRLRYSTDGGTTFKTFYAATQASDQTTTAFTDLEHKDNEEDSPFGRPGDVRSIPRDGRPKDMESPGFEWSRQPAEDVASVQASDRAPRSLTEDRIAEPAAEA